MLIFVSILRSILADDFCEDHGEVSLLQLQSPETFSAVGEDRADGKKTNVAALVGLQSSTEETPPPTEGTPSPTEDNFTMNGNWSMATTPAHIRHRRRHSGKSEDSENATVAEHGPNAGAPGLALFVCFGPALFW